MNYPVKTLEIKAARMRLGYSQKDVADELGISASAYEKKERGVAKFSTDEVFDLAKTLGLSLNQTDDYLLGGRLNVFFANELPNGRAETV